MSETKHEIEIDGTKYTWIHYHCHCFGHCNEDQLLVDGEPYGRTDNPELCSLVVTLIEEVNKFRASLAQL
jgi:hypothetical protein